MNKHTGKKKVGKKTKGLRRDMYKVMDGSALMAIGKRCSSAVDLVEEY